MMSRHWFCLTALIASLVSVGVVVDTARAQQQGVFGCKTPEPGCPATACTINPGTCPTGTPNPPPYFATIYTPKQHSPCGQGGTPPCPYRQVVTCELSAYSGTMMMPCQLIECTLTLTVSGC